MKILVTGSQGLIGSGLIKSFGANNIETAGFDLASPLNSPAHGDILNKAYLENAISSCHGIIHLAALSRVIWGEKNPELCWQTNFQGTVNVLDLACQSANKPWVLYASSREVYGEPTKLPVTEDAALNPVNIYGESKAAAEAAVLNARKKDLNTAIVRYSNVYGSAADHPDRVIPAFCKAAAYGQPLRVDGSFNTFDFVHLDDTVAGTIKIVQLLMTGAKDLPPFHLTTGRGTTLKEAAEMANVAGGKCSKIVEAPPRTFDVSRFYGDATTTMKILRWVPKVNIREGIHKLTDLFQNDRDSQTLTSSLIESAA